MTSSQAYQFSPQSPRHASGGVVALGILCIVYSVLFNLCGSLIGLSLPLWVPAFLDFLIRVAPEVQNLEALFRGPMMWYIVITSFVSLILGICFLAGGIGLLKLLPWSRTLLLAASVAAIVWNIINFLIAQLIITPWVSDAMPMEDVRSSPQAIGQIIGGFFGVIVQLALPIVLLIFLTRPSIREQFEISPEHMFKYQ